MKGYVKIPLLNVHWMVVRKMSLEAHFKDTPPEGLDPTFYHTLSYEADLALHQEYIRLNDYLKGVEYD